MDKFWHTIDDTILRHKKTLKVLSVLIIIILAVIYFVYATTYWHRHDKGRCNFEWCDGYGFLLILYILVLIGFIYFYAIKRLIWPSLKKVLMPSLETCDVFLSQKWVYPSAVCFVLLAIIVFIIMDSWKTPDRLQSFSGIIIILFLGFFFSKYPGKFNVTD
uniref:Putative product n=1 Tax=Xenopsylla cheopis TaxID=163159 RepID=A0A6M2DZG2_XENCH